MKGNVNEHQCGACSDFPLWVSLKKKKKRKKVVKKIAKKIIKKKNYQKLPKKLLL